MSIDINLKKIENAIKDQDILRAFNEIKKTREKYPYNNKVNILIEKYKNEFQRKCLINSKEIIGIYQNNKPTIAITKLEKLLLKDPNNPLLNSTIGNLQGIQEKFSKAKIYHEKAVLLNPFEDTFYLNLLQTLNKLGNFKQALKIIIFANIINPSNYEVRIGYARILFSVKDLEKSFSVYEELIEKNKNNAQLKIEFCKKLLTAKETKKITKILKTIKNNYSFEEVLILEGLVKLHEKKINEAIILFNSALKHEKNDNSLIYSYIALCYEEKLNFHQAKLFHQKALNANLSNYLVLKNYANHNYFIGNINKAEELYLKTLNINNFDYETKYNLSLIQLFKNNFVDGWSNFKFRWLSQTFHSKEKKLQMPYYKNEDGQNKILIWSESGIGDQILYSRFFKNLSLKKYEIYSTINSKLFNLFSRSFPAIKFVNTIDLKKINCHLPMGDLCQFYINNQNDVKKNALSYLKVNDKLSKKITEKLSFKKKICGISWFSKNNDIGENKSIKLEELKKILLIPNYVFLDLQYGDTSDERNEFFKKYGVEIFKFKEIDNFNDIDGLLSLINICDMVLSVSNTTVHLAGGIGKKTFLMLPKGKGNLWYWSKEKEQSIWYKSVNVFQQDVYNSWEKVINRIYKEII